MAEHDWFRRTSWTADDRAEFAARLKRSRSSFHKAQYLRIQAFHLYEAGAEPLLRAALDLLEQLVSHFPEDSELSSAHMQRGMCLGDLGEYDAAFDAYRDSMKARRQAPNWQNAAYLEFGELALALKTEELYDEALRALDEFGGNEVFPSDRFRAAVIRALIAGRSGNSESARRCAREALESAAATESPFRYHRKLGLVRSVDPGIIDELRALVDRL